MRLLLASFLCAPLMAQAATLSVCTEASPDGFDVVQYNALTTTNAAADMLMNRLVEYDAAQSLLIPSLASAWSISDDGLQYDFTLRSDVAFHQTADFTPERALNAEDVVFSFQRMLDTQHPWHQVASNGYPHAQSMKWPTLIESVEAIDPQHVRIRLKQRDATFLATLSMGFASIYPAQYAAQLLAAGTPEKLNSAPVGSGPFVLERFQKDAVVRYRAHDQYFAGKPALDRVIFAITPDSNVRLQKLRRGECHIALSPKPQDVQAIKADKNLKSAQTPAFMTAFVGINSQHPPLDNQKVRQAINLAFDKQSYLNAVFEGSAQAADSPYPNNTWSYAQDLKGYAYNPEQAKQLLNEAGFADGFSTTIWTRPSGSLLNPNPTLGAQLLQADLGKIGIDAQIRVIEWGELIRRAKAGEHDLLFMGWAGDNGDPDNFLTPQFACASVESGLNFARYCEKGLDELIAQGKTSTDQDARSQLYQQAQHLIHQQALWLPLAHPTAFALLDQHVEGYSVSPFGRLNLAPVSLSR